MKVYTAILIVCIILLQNQITISFTHITDGSVTPESIRIKADYSDINMNLGGPTTAQKEYISNKLIPGAILYFESLLKIKRLTSPFQIAFAVNGFTIPTDHGISGVSDADYIFYIRTLNEPSQSYLAYASHILLDTDTNRPIAGIITINMNNFNIEEDHWQANMNTIVHEMTHAFVFSPDLWQEFINVDGSKKASADVVNGAPDTPTSIKTSQALEKAKDHFNCPTMTEVPIEQDGGAGSAYSHWERRYFYNEFITASAIENLQVTTITLGVYEDSGWYEPDYTKAGEIKFGKNQGCDFVNSATQCDSGFKEFCTTASKQGCSRNHRYKAVCSLASNSDTFFSNSQSCKIMTPYAEGDCTLDKTGESLLGETYGLDSICAVTTIVSQTPQPQTLSQEQIACYQYECDGSNNVVYVVDGTKQTCNTPGQQLNFDTSNYKGYLICPEEPDQICPTECNRRGIKRATCACNPGFTGDSCQYYSECIPDCEYCTDLSTCAKCVSGKYVSLDKKQCLSDCSSQARSRAIANPYDICQECPAGEFPIDPTNKAYGCQSCDLTHACKICQDLSTCTEYSSCALSYFLKSDKSACLNNCSEEPGTYTSGSNCISCAATMQFCVECTSGSSCQKYSGCPSGKFLTVDETQCIDSCEDLMEGYWSNINNNKCEVCYVDEPYCKQCNASGSCIYYSSCPPGKILKSDNKACLNSCDEEPYTKANLDNTQCKPCVMVDNKCVACGEDCVPGKCHLEFDNNSCTECQNIDSQTNKYLILLDNTNESGKCVTQADCLNDNTKTIYYPQHSINDDQTVNLCLNDCPLLYKVDDDRICQYTGIPRCNFDAGEYIYGLTCTQTCPTTPTYYFHYNADDIKKCLEQCPDQYFGNYENQQCENCNDQCSNCYGGKDNECTSCNYEFTLKGSYCLSEEQLTCPSSQKYTIESYSNITCTSGCASDEFEDTTGSCIKCNPECKTCKDRSSFCTTCNENYYFLQLDGLCLEECPVGMETIETDKTCKSCTEGCQKCNDQKQCVQCRNTFFLYTQEEQDPLCYLKCPTGYFGKAYNSEDQIDSCFQCDENCFTCEEEAEKCTSCSSDKTFFALPQICFSSEETIETLKNVEALTEPDDILKVATCFNDYYDKQNTNQSSATTEFNKIYTNVQQISQNLNYKNVEPKNRKLQENNQTVGNVLQAVNLLVNTKKISYTKTQYQSVITDLKSLYENLGPTQSEKDTYFETLNTIYSKSKTETDSSLSSTADKQEVQQQLVDDIEEYTRNELLFINDYPKCSNGSFAYYCIQQIQDSSEDFVLSDQYEDDKLLQDMLDDKVLSEVSGIDYRLLQFDSDIEDYQIRKPIVTIPKSFLSSRSNVGFKLLAFNDDLPSKYQNENSITPSVQVELVNYDTAEKIEINSLGSSEQITISIAKKRQRQRNPEILQGIYYDGSSWTEGGITIDKETVNRFYLKVSHLTLFAVEQDKKPVNWWDFDIKKYIYHYNLQNLGFIIVACCFSFFVVSLLLAKCICKNENSDYAKVGQDPNASNIYGQQFMKRNQIQINMDSQDQENSNPHKNSSIQCIDSERLCLWMVNPWISVFKSDGFKSTATKMFLLFIYTLNLLMFFSFAITWKLVSDFQVKDTIQYYKHIKVLCFGLGSTIIAKYITGLVAGCFLSVIDRQSFESEFEDTKSSSLKRKAGSCCFVLFALIWIIYTGGCTVWKMDILPDDKQKDWIKYCGAAALLDWLVLDMLSAIVLLCCTSSTNPSGCLFYIFSIPKFLQR